ncbi:MAG: fibronectin type III domain-containing protein [Chloroflexi bacterium]|nr:fibronectin type III domain-containing protein [Chloroflexota bacterium]
MQTKPQKSNRYRKSIISVILFFLLTAMMMTAAAQEDQPATPPDTEVQILSQVQDARGVTTVALFSVKQDAFLSSGQPNTNFGSSSTLNTGYSAGTLQAMRGLYQFNLASIPSNAIINSATINFYMLSSTPSNDYNMGLQGQFMKSSWNEYSVTWNNANYLGGDINTIGDVNNNSGWKNGDVSNAARQWISGARPNYGIIITGDESPQRNRSRVFYSREQVNFSTCNNPNTGNSCTPYMVVDYTVSCDTTPPTSTINGLVENGTYPQYTNHEFTVFWGGSDSAPSGCTPSGIAYYDVHYRLDSGSWHHWKQATALTSGTFKSGSDGVFVEYYVRAVDHAGNKEPGPNQSGSQPKASTTGDTIDPVANINSLPDYSQTTINLTWSGSDNRSGVKTYDIQYRVNGGGWQTALSDVLASQTSYTFTGVQAGFYEVRARATDNARNTQDWTGPQASTTVVGHPVAQIISVGNGPNIIKDLAVTSFPVRWAIFDFGNPLTGIDIYYKYRGGAWIKWQTFSASETVGTFDFTALGLGDGSYQFEAVALSVPPGTNEPITGMAEGSIIVDHADQVYPQSYMPAMFN